MEEEPLGSGALAGGEDAVQVAGRHRVAGVWVAAGGDPEDHLVRIADRRQCPFAFGEYELVEELLRKPELHVEEAVDTGQFDAEQRLYDEEGVGLGERRVPAEQALHPVAHSREKIIVSGVSMIYNF